MLLKRMINLFQKFILVKDFFKKYSIKMMKLGVKNRLFFHPAKLNNILDINLNRYYFKV